SAVSPDGKLLAVVQPIGALVLQVPEGTVKAQVAPAGATPTADLAFSPGGKLLAVATYSGHLYLSDLLNPREAHPYGGPAGKPVAVGGDGGVLTFSPDNRLLLAHYQGNQLRLLRTDAPRDVAGFVAPNDMLLRVCFAADGKQLIALDQLGSLRRYD